MQLISLMAAVVFGTAAVAAAPAPAAGAAGGLPGLDAVQSGYARSIIAKAKTAGVGRRGCAAAIATGLVESTLMMYANSAVPESLRHHHDRVGSDHDSIGLFQQRASVYRNIACDMDAGCSAGQFFARIKGVSGWHTMATGTLSQTVQQSSYPGRYGAQARAAAAICAAGGL
ncbi:uncharacterized protein MAM_01194 [Metarhizium album ARSEF 1941]|uniref:NLP/P60 protein n=1 Tax=Metarhizium album (strain ARSEF 1941) TaxID=1081103 RepID=A0A0B2X541_METAS|nr:uncharacterized protein MAM_01194 [Metarhizium album ARSEF 1941]KHO00416.1 hypothetical protein MAM_01194 [Metarhizium album ARSEF 1941]